MNANMSDSDVSDSSSVSLTSDEDEEDEELSDEEDEEEETASSASSGAEIGDEDVDEDVDEEEDEVVRAIVNEKKKQRDHPPNIQMEDLVTDVCFHPTSNIIALAMVTGDVYLYKYGKETNELVQKLEVHEKACRDIEFNATGSMLFSIGKERTVMLTDASTGELLNYYEKAHSSPIYCLSVIDEDIFATGDEDGEVRMWDCRVLEKPVFTIKRNSDLISDMVYNEAKKYLLCTSGDGSLLTLNIPMRKFHMISEEYSEELTCISLFRSETKVVAGSMKGNMVMYNWGEFGLHSDVFPGPKVAINAMLPLTEHIAVTACEDGALRATHLFPHRHLGVVGQHDVSADHLDICRDGLYVASSGADNLVKFWNIRYFEDLDRVSSREKQDKKKDLANNLPSSKLRNIADFFDGLKDD